MFYYEFYDPDQNRFANISLFFFEPKTFQLKGRLSPTSTLVRHSRQMGV